MAVHTETSMFAKEALETGIAWIDCGATKSIGSWEAVDVLGRMNEQKHGCLAASSLHHIMHGSDIHQHNDQVATDTSQTGTTSPDSHTRQHLGPMQHHTTVFAPLTANTNEINSNVSIRSRCTQEGRMPSIDGTSGRGATSPWSAGAGSEVHDQGSSF